VKLSELTMKMTAREKVAVQPPVELPDRRSLTRIP
jgi:hypothetical protein